MSGLRDKMNRLRISVAAAESSSNEDGRIAIGSNPDSNDEQILNDVTIDKQMDSTNDMKIETVSDSDSESETLSASWLAMGVKLHYNERGSFLLRKVTYGSDYQHGIHRLGELQRAAGGLTAFHQEQLQAEQLLFLDLETTGLGVGAGNVPFMVGLAYWLNGEFIVEQTLIRHPAEERAMLAYIHVKLAEYRYLVTYNGKTFDWPVMQNRFILNGYGSGFWQPLHLDFLHPSRSIWRNTLTSCRLSHVEEERLGIERVDDVPGSLAPQLYFQYLAEGDPEPLEGVFRHNEIDMLSLACLTIRFGHLLLEREGSYVLPLPTEPEELVRTGLWLEKMGHSEQAERMFTAAERSEHSSVSTLIMLAARDKKAGNWQRAVVLWQKAVQHPAKYGATVNSAYIELAMYYEHKLKDYDSALQYATEALELALNHPLLRRDAKRRVEIDSIRNRTERLKRKGRKEA
ncbi:MAG: ribonuclease H-like domain-containing protein [Candidatus Pristimantibacillus sp.]